MHRVLCRGSGGSTRTKSWARTVRFQPDLAKGCAYLHVAVVVMRRVVIRRITDSVMACQRPVGCVRHVTACQRAAQVAALIAFAARLVAARAAVACDNRRVFHSEVGMGCRAQGVRRRALIGFTATGDAVPSEQVLMAQAVPRPFGVTSTAREVTVAAKGSLLRLLRRRVGVECDEIRRSGVPGGTFAHCLACSWSTSSSANALRMSCLRSSSASPRVPLSRRPRGASARTRVVRLGVLRQFPCADHGGAPMPRR
jgi:hypothetical protein